ncbi:MAG: DUF2007 domain-containing protein [Alistipes sp.]|nr:DUF2007 domain-containing protein [Alistipes sp.]
MENETLTVVAEYNSAAEAEIARTVLENAGIRSTIRNEYMASIYPVGAMPAQVVVRAEEAGRAHELLQRR